jgi:hypothetical protein
VSVAQEGRLSHHLRRRARTIACLLVLFVGEPAAAQSFYAAPDGIDNGQCTQVAPCTARGAAYACHSQPLATCWVYLADGLDLDPQINLVYYRFTWITGNCQQPQNVILRASIPSNNLIQVQDNAIGKVQCLTMDASPGVLGVNGGHAAAHHRRLRDNYVWPNARRPAY